MERGLSHQAREKAATFSGHFGKPENADLVSTLPVKRWELVFEGERGILLDAKHGCPFECTELVYAESVGASSSHVSDGASGVDGFEAFCASQEAQEANDPEPQEANDPEPQPQEANDPEPQEANVPEPQDANDPEP
jgi:hypothetical protein